MLRKVTAVNTGSGMILWLASSLSAVAVIPFISALMPGALSDAAEEMQISTISVIIVSLAQSFIVLGVATFAGLWAARKLALGAPLIDAMLNNRPLPYNLMKATVRAITISLAVGAVIHVLEITVFRSIAVELAQQSQGIELWKRTLASFYGGCAEEILLRLFLLSMVALVIRTAADTISSTRSGLGCLTNKVFWAANALTAVFFALLHLPIASDLMPLTPLFVTRTILLNGIVGLFAGLFFRKFGIELAILFHFIVDLFLHVLVPMLT